MHTCQFDYTVCFCRDRSELQSLIAALQEQKSHPGEKSRSATPSTIESDVASVEGLSLILSQFSRVIPQGLGLKRRTFFAD